MTTALFSCGRSLIPLANRLKIIEIFDEWNVLDLRLAINHGTQWTSW